MPTLFALPRPNRFDVIAGAVQMLARLKPKDYALAARLMWKSLDRSARLELRRAYPGIFARPQRAGAR